MIHKLTQTITALLIAATISVSGCIPMSEYDSQSPTNLSGAAIGAAAGVGVGAVLGAPKPVMGFLGLGGAGLGYYFTTLRFASRGIVQAGGKVYTLGDTVIIEIPTDNLFDTNTAEFLPRTEPVMDSVVSVLKRYPCNHIIISGNTSGFGTRAFEQKLSESRASQVASYLWLHGISDNRSQMHGVEFSKGRKLIYVGYGDAFPIANNLHIDSLRSNSRIQIIAYLGYKNLHWDQFRKHHKLFSNIGGSGQPSTVTGDNPENYAGSFTDDRMPDNTTASRQYDFNKEFPPEVSSTHNYRPYFRSYNNAESASQTSEGGNVGKHWGSRPDWKGEGVWSDKLP